MTTVRDHFDSIFLGSLPTDDLADILNNRKCNTTDGDILKEVPLDSVCGNAQAIPHLCGPNRIGARPFERHLGRI